MSKILKIAAFTLAGLVGLIGPVVGVLAGGYILILSKAKLELGGDRPNKQTLGTALDINQRAMEQFCTGVIVTPESTWLVGRREGTLDDFSFAKQAPDLSALLGSNKRANDQMATTWAMMAGSRATTSFISRLDPQGNFQLVAVVPEVACLQATPDGKRVFLLTGMDRPDQPKNSRPAPKQTVVFQSDDQGRTWQWRTEGLFPDHGYVAWSLDPYYFDSQSLWAWRDLEGYYQGYQRFSDGQSRWTWRDLDGHFGYYQETDTSTVTTTPVANVVPTGLQYSPDGGAHIEDVVAGEPLFVKFDQARKKVDGEVEWADLDGSLGELKRHVAQFSADRATLWLSQTFSYRRRSDHRHSYNLSLTVQASLIRRAGRWEIVEIDRHDGWAIQALQDNHAGKVVAVIAWDQRRDLTIAVLDREHMRWEEQGTLPGAFSFLTTSVGIRNLYVGREVMVINTTSFHRVPRMLRPGGVTVSADAVFYSSDWGRSWKRLSMNGYLGLLGIDREKNRAVWASGNWYDSQDRQVYTYGLHVR